jgi:hypothetical protein
MKANYNIPLMTFQEESKYLQTELAIRAIPYVETLSIAALKANLFYADAVKQKAYLDHTEALMNYHLALDALNQAIVKKNNLG